jgi:hypothetical protein
MPNQPLHTINLRHLSETFGKTAWGVILGVLAVWVGGIMAAHQMFGSDVVLPLVTPMAYLMIKHFIADGPLQTAYQYLNKGRFGHPGGIIHAGIHGALTGAAVMLWSWGFDVEITLDMVIACSLFDFIVHYLCDWAKVVTTKKFHWSEIEVDPNTKAPICLRIFSNNFFIALMFDQLVHSMTYVAIFYWLLTTTLS